MKMDGTRKQGLIAKFSEIKYKQNIQGLDKFNPRRQFQNLEIQILVTKKIKFFVQIECQEN